jgi:hypothetical protein
MTAEESKTLKVGDRVTWKYDQADAGKVIETGYHAVKIEWGNGQVGIIDHRDMQSVTPG